MPTKILGAWALTLAFASSALAAPVRFDFRFGNSGDIASASENSATASTRARATTRWSAPARAPTTRRCRTRSPSFVPASSRRSRRCPTSAPPEVWGKRTLDEIDSATCRSYVASRKPNTGGARRELEDLRSAGNLAVADKICREAVKITLPPKPAPRKNYLERSAVARLVWHAYRKREIQTVHKGPRKGEKIVTRRRPMLHIARFILFGLYTGTRSGRIWTASFERREGHPGIDVENGVFHREATGETASKTKRAPSIRIPCRLLAHLRRWKAGGIDPAKATSFLCEYRKGVPGDPKKGFARLVRDVLGDESADIVRHSLRHTAAIWLLQGNEDPHAVAGYPGMRTDTLISVYGHHHPEFQESIVDSFTTGRAGRKRTRK